MFQSIFNNSTAVLTSISDKQMLICTAVSLLLGIVIAVVTKVTNGHSSKSILTTLILIPVIVQLIIMMVNGNLGVGVSVMGAFSLVRFRSVPGNGKEIVSIFSAMAIGLATGTGYIGVAVAATAVISIVLLILGFIRFGEDDKGARQLKIIIPEDLDFTEIFDDIFEKYVKQPELEKVKTTNMGSMFELTYNIILKDAKNEKKLIDEIRCRNGNLTVTLSHREHTGMEL